MDSVILPKRGLVIRPFLGVNGLYLMRGWALWLFRHYSKPLFSMGLFSLTLISGAVTSFQTGWLSIQASMQSGTRVAEVEYISNPVHTTTTPAPAIATASAPPSITLLPYIVPRRPWNGYSWGHCTYYAANRRYIAANWGHARTWYKRAQIAGYETGAMPRIGAIAWTTEGRYGHVAIVEQTSGAQVLVSEMNYTGLNRISSRWVHYSTFKYIY